MSFTQADCTLLKRKQTNESENMFAEKENQIKIRMTLQCVFENIFGEKKFNKKLYS